jgi:hypothetical protein
LHVPPRAKKYEPLKFEDVLFTAADQFRDAVQMVAPEMGVSA